MIIMWYVCCILKIFCILLINVICVRGKFEKEKKILFILDYVYRLKINDILWIFNLILDFFFWCW